MGGVRHHAAVRIANAGVPLDLPSLGNPIAVAVALGLTVGKPIGIVLFCWLAIRLGVSRLPEGVSWPLLIGGACLAGIGFTMSLFINGLAFDAANIPGATAAGKIGTMTGSLASAILAREYSRSSFAIAAGLAEAFAELMRHKSRNGEGPNRGKKGACPLFAHSSFATVVRPSATSNSLNSGTSIAAIVKPKAVASVRNGTSGSADSSVPGFAMSTFVTQ